jgi:hypothetical protein
MQGELKVFGLHAHTLLHRFQVFHSHCGLHAFNFFHSRQEIRSGGSKNIHGRISPNSIVKQDYFRGEGKQYWSLNSGLARQAHYHLSHPTSPVNHNSIV